MSNFKLTFAFSKDFIEFELDKVDCIASMD
jgi:hypothetical protein